MLTLAAGQGRVEGGLGVLVGEPRMRMPIVQGVKKPRLGCWFQRHWPVHIVIVGPDESYLVERKHRDLLEVQPVHSEGMSGVHGSDPGRWPGRRATCSQLSRHIRQTWKHNKTRLESHSHPGRAWPPPNLN